MRFKLSDPGARYFEDVLVGRYYWGGHKDRQVTGSVLQPELTASTRPYIERMALQINGAYEAGWYDASMVICRRLMESLIIEVYVSRERHSEIQTAEGTFFTLENLVTHLIEDQSMPLSRGVSKGMNYIKKVGDRAAHDRFYLTTKPDIDEKRPEIRSVITELIHLSGVRK